LQNKEIKNKYRQTLAAKTQEQKQQARNKTVETLQSKYGVDAASRIQLSLLARELLFDKEKLGKFIDGKTRDQVLEELTISPSTLFKITTAFGISDRFVAPTRSNFERAVCEFLDQNNIKYIINCRTVIAPKEVDIYIPTHKIAIECSGLYWHAEQSAGRDRHYHSLKYTECSKQDIRLVTIFEDCWRDQQDIVKSRLAHLLNLTKSVIYARKCSIRPVDKTEEKTFLKLNHLQGAVGSTIRLGLYYENKLVSLMTFGRSRFSQKHTYELLRFCNAINTKVVGSASRLFKEFIKQYPGTVISYSDNCWSSDSGLYSTLGFGKKSSTVGYFYTDYRHRYNRIKFQKHKIKPLVENADGKTEWQIMQELGYDRIWDCGQTTWIFDSTLNRQ
jgi:hypothetical protein